MADGFKPEVENFESGHVERMDPDYAAEAVLAVHQVRYEFAKAYCQNKIVLDMACGVGYGTSLLADTAKSIVGMDIDSQAVSYAVRKFTKPNLSYVQGNVTATPFRGKKFDVVVSFETIEHLNDIPAYLEEIKRILNPGGCCLISTPKVRKTTHKPKNPHHTIEYSIDDFKKILQPYFSDLEIYGQVLRQSASHRLAKRLDVLNLRRFLPKIMKKNIVEAVGSKQFEQMTIKDQIIDKNSIRDAQTMIALCRVP